MVQIILLKLQSSAGNLIWDGILIQFRLTPSFSTMVGRLPLPTFNTHLANFRYFLELAAMTRMLIWRRRIVTSYQKCNRSNETLTMSSHLPLGTTGKIYQKSPPKTTIFPPKIFSVACASSNCIKSRRVRSIALKAQHASSVPHPKWSYQLYAPTRPLSSSVWCYKSTHRAYQSKSWILNGPFCHLEAAKMQFIMR